jgi:hypothetical protein
MPLRRPYINSFTLDDVLKLLQANASILLPLWKSINATAPANVKVVTDGSFTDSCDIGKALLCP